MSAFQRQIREEIVFLGDGAGPVTGLLPGDVTVRIRKPGGAFEVKALDGDNFQELESGLYLLIFSEEDMDTLGTFTYSANATTADYTWSSFQIVPQPIAISAAPGVCTVSGNIVDLGGSPGTSTKIQFHIGPVPSVAGGTSLITANILTTVPDAFGNFSVHLLRNKEVIVEIPEVGLKHQITVPDQESANILDLLPPIS
jgi:hypothetical protein